MRTTDSSGAALLWLWLHLLVISGLGYIVCIKKNKEKTDEKAMSLSTVPLLPPPPPEEGKRSEKKTLKIFKKDEAVDCKKIKEKDLLKSDDPALDELDEKKTKKEEEKKANTPKDEKRTTTPKDEKKMASTPKEEVKKEGSNVQPKEEPKKAGSNLKTSEEPKKETSNVKPKEENKLTEKKDESKVEEKKSKMVPKEEEKKEVSNVKTREESKLTTQKCDVVDGPLGVEISPSELAWEFESGQMAVKVMNKTGKKIIYKVKTMASDIYSVTPVSGVLNDQETLDLAVVRKKSPMKDDNLFYVFYAAGPNDDVATFETTGTKKQHIMIKMRKK